MFRRGDKVTFKATNRHGVTETLTGTIWGVTNAGTQYAKYYVEAGQPGNAKFGLRAQDLRHAA